VTEVLAERGVEHELVESAPGRGSVVAWAESGEPEPSLLPLSARASSILFRQLRQLSSAGVFSVVCWSILYLFL